MKLILSLLVVFSLFVASLAYYFWEPRNFTKDSVAYQLKIDPQIKNFPIWEPTSEPLYKYFVGDGVKQTTVAMTYNTSLRKRELVNKVEKLGFTCQLSSQAVYCNKHNNTSVLLSNAPGSLEITVDLTFWGLD